MRRDTIKKCSFCGQEIDIAGQLVQSRVNKEVFICSKCSDIAQKLHFREKYGEKACQQLAWKEKREAMERMRKIDFKLPSLTPHEIHRQLDRFIIGQEKAKKVLSVAVYNHVKRLQDETGLIKKSNILLAGPSGCGKTLIAKTLAKILSVPFAICDSTSLTEAGYVGEDVEMCLQRLLDAADGDLELAQKGIIYLDEIDKIAKMGENRSITRDISGEGVQAGLLKLIEGFKVSVPVNGRRRHSQEENIIFDTSNVLFVCGGAFDGLFKMEAKKTVGFGERSDFKVIKTEKSINEQLTPEALKKYGIMPELVGRLPILCALTKLNEDDLVRILTEPEDSITKEYELLFSKDDVILKFEDEALKEVARLAIDRNTGARGIRSILEDILIDIMYDLPDRTDVTECIITKETVKTKIPVLTEEKHPAKTCIHNA